MHSRFIKLYDDNGYEYIVSMDKITCVSVEGKRVWVEGNSTLDISGKSMGYLRRRLVGSTARSAERSFK